MFSNPPRMGINTNFLRRSPSSVTRRIWRLAWFSFCSEGAELATGGQFAIQRACACSALLDAQAPVAPGNWASSTRLSSRTLGAGPPPDGAAIVGLTDGGVREAWRRMRLRRRPLDARGPAIECLLCLFFMQIEGKDWPWRGGYEGEGWCDEK